MYKELRPEQIDILVGSPAVNDEFSKKIRELDRRLQANGMSYRDWETLNDRQHDIFADNLFLDGECATSVDNYVMGAVDSCWCPDVIDDLHHHSPVLMREIEKQQDMLPDMKVKIGESLNNLNETIYSLVREFLAERLPDDLGKAGSVPQEPDEGLADRLKNPQALAGNKAAQAITSVGGQDVESEWNKNIARLRSAKSGESDAGGKVNEIWIAALLANPDLDGKVKYKEPLAQVQIDRSEAQAKDIQQYIDEENLGNISKVYWSGGAFPWMEITGLDVNTKKNPSDLLIEFEDGKFLGVSLKSYGGSSYTKSNPGENVFADSYQEGGLDAGKNKAEEIREKKQQQAFVRIDSQIKPALKRKVEELANSEGKKVADQINQPTTPQQDYDIFQKKFQSDNALDVMDGILGIAALTLQSNPSSKLPTVTSKMLKTFYKRLYKTFILYNANKVSEEMYQAGKIEQQPPQITEDTAEKMPGIIDSKQLSLVKDKKYKLLDLSVLDSPELLNAYDLYKQSADEALHEVAVAFQESFNQADDPRGFITQQYKYDQEKPRFIVSVGSGGGKKAVKVKREDPFKEVPEWADYAERENYSFEALPPKTDTVVIVAENEEGRKESIGTVRAKYASFPFGSIKFAVNETKGADKVFGTVDRTSD